MKLDELKVFAVVDKENHRRCVVCHFKYRRLVDEGIREGYPVPTIARFFAQKGIRNAPSLHSIRNHVRERHHVTGSKHR